MAQSLTDWSRTLFGDPVQLAEFQFRLAHELCGRCRQYHALWPYRRLAHMVAGIEGSFEILRLLLRASMPPRGRILIAGCADAGLLALTARALEDVPCSIEIADRCLTPLAVVRRYADEHRLSVTTHEVELGRERLSQRYDVILGHGSLRTIARGERADFLRSIGEMLAPGGTLIQAEPYYGANASDPFINYVDDMIATLLQQSIALPEPEEAFRARIARDVSNMSKRINDGLGARELAVIVGESGLVLRVAAEYELKGTDMLLNPRLNNFGMQIAVALPAGTAL
jgi:hypothetical protein